MNKAYFLISGLKKLSTELRGDENIYLGIRPYGFHAGNALTLLVYPYLLCKEFEKTKKVARFNFFLFINDWEQDRLSGPDMLKYPYNIYPQSTTFQYTPHPFDKTKNIVDYWEPKIFKEISLLRKHFNLVKINTIRNSSLKNNKRFKYCLLKTLKEPQVIAKILKRHTKRPLLKKPLAYALAVCPYCKSTRGHTSVDKNLINHNCFNCNKFFVNNYEIFDYWFYHKPLAIPRIDIFNIDVCITGFEHFKEGDYLVRKALMKEFKSVITNLKTLYTPTIFSYNGRIMGKSNGNTTKIPMLKLLKVAVQYPKSNKLELSSIINRNFHEGSNIFF